MKNLMWAPLISALLIFLSVPATEANISFVGSPALLQEANSVELEINKARRAANQKQLLWAQKYFSKPAYHNPLSFRYLVHATESLGFYQYILDNGFLSPSHRDMAVSLIDQDHTGTCGYAGIIISAAASNIFAAGNLDYNSGEFHGAKDALASVFYSRGLKSPKEVLNTENYVAYNEITVDLLGTSRSKTEITGFWLQTDSFGNPRASSDIVKVIERLSNKYSLPIIKIFPPRFFYAVLFAPALEKRQVTVPVTRSQFNSLMSKASREKKKVVGIMYESGNNHVYGEFRGQQFHPESWMFERLNHKEMAFPGGFLSSSGPYELSTEPRPVTTVLKDGWKMRFVDDN